MTPDQIEWSRGDRDVKLDETSVLWHNITSVLQSENVTVFIRSQIPLATVFWSVTGSASDRCKSDIVFIFKEEK